MSAHAIDAGRLRASADDRPSGGCDVAIPLIQAQRSRARSSRTAASRVRALKEIDLTIYPGEFPIMGQSAPGKSTLMNVLVPRPADQRHYLFAGRDIQNFDADDSKLAPARGVRLRVPVTPAGVRDGQRERRVPGIYAGLSASERGVRAGRCSPRSARERLDHQPNQLSGGQRQRVSIARADERRQRHLADSRPAFGPRSSVEVMGSRIARRGTR
jgi:predicted ABC-type transport system involved in lysophospholipase L1 biosynthesis ATPase subunit